ncbi:unnamed protein product [Darwinula stevensoni]|uniref:Nascent polypeptide-associated complex subunit alpha-like UBA domain-containing protein n=1 Tax=Darwinula stevensoni TaxID=69355 RepID=A0A7R9A217_9CRUS|nr:unnamed protein product [Darwinula stevensoni]CAG0884755.1 unnamed protein product [Darwinula stevensoni]
MADKDGVRESEEGGENKSTSNSEKPRKHDSGAADLERVTDYAEDKEISSDDIQGAMTLIGDRRAQEYQQKVAREKELAKVSIKKEDVVLIMQEFEVTRAKAERTLREHRGNIIEALTALTE